MKGGGPLRRPMAERQGIKRIDRLRHPVLTVERGKPAPALSRRSINRKSRIEWTRSCLLQ